MKIIDASTAAKLIQDDWTVAINSFGGYAVPEELLESVAKRYREEKHPAKITTVTGISPGDFRKDELVGLNRLSEEGLLKGVITAHISAADMIMSMITENRIKGYCLPLGILMELLRASAAKRPGVITKVGLDTFIDPRKDGMAMNEISKDFNLVSPMKIDHEEYLFYKTFPIDACLIRGTYADEKGNISMIEEAVGDYAYEMAAAVHNNGGIVIVQVQDIVPAGSLSQKEVMLHHSLVDYVVKAKDKDLHKQSYFDDYRPELDGHEHIVVTPSKGMEMSNRKIIARRSAMELTKGALINLGIGIPSGVGAIAKEEGISDDICLSVECGLIGGTPLEGIRFGASINAEVEYNTSKMFEQYDGGILDMAFLGAAEIDQYGNVNVSRFEGKCPGPGGFIDISQNTKKICFLGTFTASGLRESVSDGKLMIQNEGISKKFIREVGQISFSGEYALQSGQKVYYITERAVFELTEKGLMLTEIAPGVELQRDILDQMDFTPMISENLKEMDSRIFGEEKMGLKY